MLYTTQDRIVTLGGGIQVHARAPLDTSLYYIHDEFTDTNGTGLASHTIAPVNLPATSWTVSSGAAAIQSNKLQFTNTADTKVVCNAGSAEAKVEAVLNLGGNTFGVGVIARWLNSSNYWLAYILNAGAGSQAVRLYQNSSGFVLRASYTVVLDKNTDYKIGLRCNGTSLKVYLDDVEIIDYTSSAHQSNTSYGLYADYGNSGQKADEFKVWKL